LGKEKAGDAFERIEAESLTEGARSFEFALTSWNTGQPFGGLRIFDASDQSAFCLPTSTADAGRREGDGIPRAASRGPNGNIPVLVRFVPWYTVHTACNQIRVGRSQSG
jgi:hypothetical protein